MTPRQFTYYCRRILAHFGHEHQRMKMLEELAELATELSRDMDGRTSPERIRGELADVIVLAEQLRQCYGPSEVDAEVERKIRRTLERYGIE